MRVPLPSYAKSSFKARCGMFVVLGIVSGTGVNYRGGSSMGGCARLGPSVMSMDNLESMRIFSFLDAVESSFVRWCLVILLNLGVPLRLHRCVWSCSRFVLLMVAFRRVSCLTFLKLRDCVDIRKA